MKIQLRILLVLSTVVWGHVQIAAQTSWKGTTSTNWSTASNWTAGVPSSTVDAIIGDANFTGASQPTLTATSSCKNLTIGGSVAATLTIGRNLTINGNALINSNGTITASSGRTITLKGNWTNGGTYNATSSSARLTFSGSSQTLTGATTFKNLTINSSTTVTLANNISVGVQMTISGTFNPTASYVVSGAGALSINSTGVAYVYASTFAGNYSLSGSKSLNSASTVNYASASLAQTISSSLTYGTLRVSGGSTKSLSANLPSLSSSSSSGGKIFIDAGILDLSTFTANRGTSTTGGSFIIASGASLKIGGTNGFPSNYSTLTFASTSNVEYYGNNQTIKAAAYGNLIFSGTTGSVVKTMPGTALTIAGNFTSSVGGATSLSYTAAQNITVNGVTTIGSNCTFSGASYIFAFKGNWINNGTFTGSTSSVTFSGISSNLSGTGTNNFYNLSFIASGITANSSTSLNVSGDLNTTAPGIFTHAAGGTVTMTGASKTLTGNGFEFSNFVISGSISSTANYNVSGNITNNGTFTASAGTTTLNGVSKSINGSASFTFYALSIEGSITTANSFSVLSTLSIALTGSFSATNGTATFNGTSILSGTANLYNVTISATKTLTLGTSSNLGIANTFTKTGTLDVSTLVPNTINYNGSSTQNLVSTTYHNLELSNGGTKTPLGNITVNNDFTINSGVTFNASSFVFSLYRHWNNLGTFTPATSDVQMRGINAATITGTTTFNTLTVNKSSQAIKITLANNVTASNITMTTGNMATGSFSITTTGTRTGNGIIIGTIVHSHSFTNGTAYAFEGPNNLITFTSPSGISSVTVNTIIGEIADFDPSIESLIREYNISVNSGTYSNATLRFHYENNELNAFSEPFLALYKFNSGILWDSLGFNSRDTGINYVEKSNITSIDGRFTCSGTRNVVRWNGSVSNAWNNASNWTTVSGSSMANRVPTSTDAAYLGSSTFTNQPTLSSTQQTSVLRFGSAQAVTLTISSGSLTTSGSIRGNWSVPRSHTIDVTGGSLVSGTHLLLGDTATGRDITLKIGAGTVSVTNNLEHTGSGAINFTGSGTLNIAGDYNHTSGNFNAGSGTVSYSGGESQIVAPVTYNNLVITKLTERASFDRPTIVNGDLTITNGGEVIVFDSLWVTGNVIIDNSTYLYNEASIIHVGGNWSNDGIYLSNNGTVSFNGTGNQTVDANTFTNLSIDKLTGTLRLTDDIIIDNNLSIINGTLNLDTFTANRSSDGGTLTIGASGILTLAGANNFPDHYLTNNLNTQSTVSYDGSIAQTIRKVTYGNVSFSNGGSLSKSMIGNVTINGNLTINSGAKFNPDIFSLTLNGNLTNNGTFSPGSSTLNLNGTNKTVTGNATLNNLSVVTGSYTVASGTISIAGDLYIESTGSLDFGSNATTLDGDLTNKGTLTSNGTATFTGNRVQTLQLLNSITSASTGIVNFNGTVSPIINSNSSPTFATVNINNTSGITASVPWYTFIAFNVASGASFDGGPLTHTFYGSFTNNGTVLSSGVLKFSPGSPYSASATIKLDGTAFTSTGEVEFGGSVPLTITNSNPTLTVVNITNTHSSGITPPSNWTILDELKIANGAIFNAGASTSHLISGSFINNGTLNGQTSTIRFNGNPSEINGLGTSNFNNITIESAADLTLNSTINIGRNFVIDGNIIADAGTIVFNGSNSTNISGSAASISLGDVEQIKTLGATTTLSLPVSIFGDLTLTSGVILSTTSNLLTIEDDATSTGGNANSYVSGPIKKIGNDSFIFPLGKGTKWARLGIGAPSNTTDAFTAQYFNSNYSDTLTMAGSPAPVLHDVSTREYWMCDRTTGTSNVTVQLFWESTWSGINTYTSDLVVARWNGTGWENKGQSAITAGTPGNVTSNTITSFSPFTFGSLSGFINPLPITLLDFSGELKENKVILNWKTVNEINNAYFTIERSRDGFNFEQVGTVKGAGNSDNILNYELIDYRPFNGISYYRLKQTDLNGSSVYAGTIVTINNIEKGQTISLYPNPASQSLTLNIEGGIDEIITIKNSDGRIIYTAQYNNNANTIDISNFETGIYIIEVDNKYKSRQLKFVKI